MNSCTSLLASVPECVLAGEGMAASTNCLSHVNYYCATLQTHLAYLVTTENRMSRYPVW